MRFCERLALAESGQNSVLMQIVMITIDQPQLGTQLMYAIHKGEQQLTDKAQKAELHDFVLLIAQRLQALKLLRPDVEIEI